MSRGLQVSKFTLCVKILKCHSLSDHQCLAMVGAAKKCHDSLQCIGLRCKLWHPVHGDTTAIHTSELCHGAASQCQVCHIGRFQRAPYNYDGSAIIQICILISIAWTLDTHVPKPGLSTLWCHFLLSTNVAQSEGNPWLLEMWLSSLGASNSSESTISLSGRT